MKKRDYKIGKILPLRFRIKRRLILWLARDTAVVLNTHLIFRRMRDTYPPVTAHGIGRGKDAIVENCSFNTPGLNTLNVSFRDEIK